MGGAGSARLRRAKRRRRRTLQPTRGSHRLCAQCGRPFDLAAHAELIGAVSATVAEYQALLAGLQRAHQLGLERVDARSDSRVVVAHLSRERIPTNPKLVSLAEEILDLTTRIGSVTVTWIPADANGAAHALVADALAPRAD